MDDKEMYESLIKWLKILELSGPCGESKHKFYDSQKWMMNLN